MAFSPFRAFRKHQKAFFAGLTIVCMLTFVLAGSMSRGGDFFSWVGSLISGSRQPKVATLYGKPVYGAELQQLRNQRQLANEYVEQLANRARANLFTSLFDATSKGDGSLRQRIQEIIRGWKAPEELRARSAQERSIYLGQLADMIRKLAGMEFGLRQANKETEASQITEFRDQLQRDYLQIQRIKDRKELYFGGTVKLEDLIDFMVWKHEADRRGIQLNMADVRELINRETGHRLSSGDFKSVENYLRERDRGIWNTETLRAGLADEFRVRIVKAAIMGEDNSGVSTSITPYEFWQFYRDRRTENVIAVLPIPVRQKDFLDAVGEPKDEELKKLYSEGKDAEYDPASDKPGFKVPPRIGVEWVSARADSEHYRKAADVVLAATQGTLPLAYAAMISEQYERDKYNHRLPSWTDDIWFVLHERPENVAALVGQLATGGSEPKAFSGYMAYAASAHSREVQDRLRIGLAMALSRSSPVPFTSAALAYQGTPKTEFLPIRELQGQLVEKVKETMARRLLTDSLYDLRHELFNLCIRKPEDVIGSENLHRPEVIGAMMGALTTGSTLGRLDISAPLLFGTPVVLRDLQVRSRLGAEMFLAGTRPNAFPLAGFVYQEQNRNVEALRKLIDGAVAKYGWQRGSTQKLRTRYDLGEDQGSKPLKDSYDRFRTDHPNLAQDFSSLFVTLQQFGIPYVPLQWPQEEFDNQNRDEQFKINQRYWSNAEQPFLYWKTEDKPAYVPTFDEAKDKVLALWKFDKARALAEKEAEQVKKEAEGQPDAERRLKDGSKHSERWFYLTDQHGFDKVAKLVKPLQPLFGRGDWERFQFSKSQIEYPPGDLLEKLVAMKNPGEAMVFHDQPKANYYVAALVQHIAPGPSTFYKEYNDSTTEDLSKLFQEMEDSTHYRREFEENLLAQLRREARSEIIEENRSLVDGRSRSDDE